MMIAENRRPYSRPYRQFPSRSDSVRAEIRIVADKSPLISFNPAATKLVRKLMTAFPVARQIPFCIKWKFSVGKVRIAAPNNIRPLILPPEKRPLRLHVVENR